MLNKYLKQIFFTKASLKTTKVLNKLPIRSIYLLFLIPIKVCLLTLKRSRVLLLVSTTNIVSITTTLLNIYFGRIKSIITTPQNSNSFTCLKRFNAKVVCLYTYTSLTSLKSRFQTDNESSKIYKFSI